MRTAFIHRARAGKGWPTTSKKPRRHAYAREATEPRARWCSETSRTTSLGKGCNGAAERLGADTGLALAARHICSPKVPIHTAGNSRSPPPSNTSSIRRSRRVDWGPSINRVQSARTIGRSGSVTKSPSLDPKRNRMLTAAYLHKQFFLDLISKSSRDSERRRQARARCRSMTRE